METDRWIAASVGGNVAVRDAIRIVVAANRPTIRSFFVPWPARPGARSGDRHPPSSLAVAAHAGVIDAAPHRGGPTSLSIRQRRLMLQASIEKSASLSTSQRDRLRTESPEPCEHRGPNGCRRNRLLRTRHAERVRMGTHCRIGCRRFVVVSVGAIAFAFLVPRSLPPLRRRRSRPPAPPPDERFAHERERQPTRLADDVFGDRAAAKRPSEAICETGDPAFHQDPLRCWHEYFPRSEASRLSAEQPSRSDEFPEASQSERGTATGCTHFPPNRRTSCATRMARHGEADLFGDHLA